MISVFFAGLWPFIWHILGAAVAIEACMARAYFKASARKTYFYIAAAILALLVTYITGVKNGTSRCEAQTAAVQSNVTVAVRRAIAPPGKLQHDRWDQDNKPQPRLRGFARPN